MRRILRSATYRDGKTELTWLDRMEVHVVDAAVGFPEEPRRVIVFDVRTLAAQEVEHA